jgi:hypothetical protein
MSKTQIVAHAQHCLLYRIVLSLVAAGMIVALLAWLYLVREARYGTRDVMVHAMRTAGISGVIATGGLTCRFYRLVR